MHRMQIGVMLGVVCLVLAAVWAGCSSGTSQPVQVPPQSTSAPGGSAEDGATLLNTVCSQCHGTDRITSAKKTREKWDQTVSRMITRGAQLTDAQKAVLVDYLAANYGQ
jgi:mono/diheme cytochrome c family protein